MSENKTDAIRPRLRLPLIVEGRYDKSAVLGMVDGVVITTDGFGVFNSTEKRARIKRLSEDGILLLTDSDGGGRQIRAFLSGLVPSDKLIHLYIPEVLGKERRKRKASAAGLLGVEGVGGEVLRQVLAPYLDTAEGAPCVGGITSYELYSLGLTGGEDSQGKRDKIARKLSLPTGMSAKAFLSAVNLLISKDAFLAFFD